MVSAAMSELGDLSAEAHAKALASKRGVEWDSLLKVGHAEMMSAAMSELGVLSAEARAKALALTRGVEWELFDKVGRVETMSAAISELRHLGAEGHAKALPLKRGVEWELLDEAGPAEMMSEAMGKHGPMLVASRLAMTKKRTEATEACARKIAQSEGKHWDSMWLLAQESYRERRLYVRTDTLGNQHHRHKNIPSIIF